MEFIADLRSDTVTRPSAAMREAIANADVGDDVYGEDPTVRSLETRIAEMIGKEAALFVPSGTMSNQIALLCHTRRGDEVVVGEGSHCMFYESGAAAAWSGVQFAIAGRGGLFTAADLESVIRPREYHYPRTSLVVVEDTHNRSGGRVFPPHDAIAIADRARAANLALHLDGARIWNASAATSRSPSTIAAPFDTVSVCFSKGLGAPAGSALCGNTQLIKEARRARKMLGGGMRQVGILAAGALYALENNVNRIAEDHATARAVAAIVRSAPGALVSDVETNIVNIDIPGVPAERVVAASKKRGVLIGASGASRVRVVLHLDVAPNRVEAAGYALVEAINDAKSDDSNRPDAEAT